MAIKAGILLEKLFKKAGVDTTTEELKPLFASDVEIPDEYATKVETGLLTLEAAKGNPDINRALRKSHFDAVDAKLLEIIKDSGVTVDDNYDKEPNTMNKLAIVSKSLIEAGKKKAEGANKGEAHEQLKKKDEEFAAKEAQLQQKLNLLTETLATKEKEFQLIRQSDLTDFEVSKILLGKDYIFPKEMDQSVKVNTAYSTIKNELAKKGLLLKLNEASQMVITDKDGNPGYDEKHNKIDDPNSFIDGVLAQNKLLKINDPNDQQQEPGSNGTGYKVHTNGRQKNSAVIGELDKQIASLPG